MMSDRMTFPDSVEEFMEKYKITDTDHVYSNGIEFVPIFRMKQWFEHLQDANVPSNDCISRRDTMSAIMNHSGVVDKSVAKRILTQMSSAQPEIIRCKDCKYGDRGIDEDGNPFLKCLGWVYGGTQEEDFCSHAERRTYERQT